MKKIGLFLLIIMVCSFAVFANGTQENGSSDGQLKIAFVTKSYTLPFWEYMRLAAVAMAEKEGFELIYLAPTKPYNLEEQTRIVDDLVAKKVDGIVLVPVDSMGMVPAVERANQAGIPVAICNTKLHGGDVVCFTAIENYDAMTMVTEYMMDKLGGKGNVVILEGTPGSQTSIDRLQAQKDVIAKYPGVKILASQTAKYNRAEGMQVMENLIQSYPDIDAVLAGDVSMALGAIEALRAAGKAGKVLVSGFDISPDGIKAIMDGEMSVTMNQQPDQQAVKSIQAVIDHINGKEVPETKKVDGTLIDISNVDDYKYVLEEK